MQFKYLLYKTDTQTDRQIRYGAPLYTRTCPPLFFEPTPAGTPPEPRSPGRVPCSVSSGVVINQTTTQISSMDIDAQSVGWIAPPVQMSQVKAQWAAAGCNSKRCASLGLGRTPRSCSVQNIGEALS